MTLLGSNTHVITLFLSLLQHNLLPQPARTKFISESDELILEDELQRIKLEGKIDKDKCVTGQDFSVSQHHRTTIVHRSRCLSCKHFLLCLSWHLFILSSGSVIAIYGAERNDGKFTVEDFCTADLPLQTARPALGSDR